MIVLEDPVNFGKNFSVFKKILKKEKDNKEAITNADLLDFYEVKANIFSDKLEKTKDFKYLDKSINAIIYYDKLDNEKRFKS